MRHDIKATTTDAELKAIAEEYDGYRTDSDNDYILVYDEDVLEVVTRFRDKLREAE